MLAIVGGNHSSCVAPGTHVLEHLNVSKNVGERVRVVDFDDREVVGKFMRSRPRYPDEEEILVIEHAWLALGSRVANTKICRRLTYILLHFSQYGYSDVILLTRRVDFICKQLRDAANVKFDFSA